MDLTNSAVTIAGLGTHLPERILTNDDLSCLLDTSDEWISRRTGIRARRVAGAEVCSSDLGVPAAFKALVSADLDPAAVDLVIAASISADQPMPATASRIAHEIGAVRAGACDIQAGCTGFVYALALATGMVASRLYEHVLVVGTEVISKVLDWEDRSTAILFGDGAGAVVVSPTDGSGRILGFDLGNDGAGVPLLAIPAGGSRRPASQETLDERAHYLRMNGPEVYRFATRVVPESVERVLAKCGREVGEIDLFVPHQANMRIIEAGARKVGIAADRIYTNLERYGNTSCASIPLCLAEAKQEGRLRRGDLVLMMGFGAGLTWGSCLMEWGSA